jgi:hypothetical protein
MCSRYLLLKCVGKDDPMWERPSRTLRLTELQEIAETDPEIRWGMDPRGAIPIKNSDGSISMMPPHQGFSFVKPATSALFYMCYECYDGLSIHPENDERAHQKARQFAERLGAKLFVI